MAQAVHIYNSINGRHVLNSNLLGNILEKIGEKPVAIYSVCGPLRQGKSFLLSMFLRYLITKGSQDWVNYKLQNMFQYTPGSVRETSGIYIWSEPFILKKSDGTEIALLLLDSQGSFDNQTTMQENAIVFALCTLLSSHVVFNLTSQIQEDLLQFIQFFAGFARLSDEENENRDEPFQKMLFLIRDFQHLDYEYGLHDDNTFPGEKNYKKDFLDPHENQPREVQFVHEMILSTFAEVGVYLMPHPGLRLARSGDFNVTTVEPEFLDHLKTLTTQLLNPDNIIVKKIGGSVLTGMQLKVLVVSWAAIFKSDKIPEAKSIYDATAEITHEMGKAAAIKNYSRRFKDFVMSGNIDGLSNDIIMDMHRKVEHESMQLFKRFAKLGSSQYSAKYIEKIQKKTKSILEYYQEINAIRTQISKVKRDTDVKLESMNQQQANTERELLTVQFESERRIMEERIDNMNRERDILRLETQSQTSQLITQISTQILTMGLNQRFGQRSDSNDVRPVRDCRIM